MTTVISYRKWLNEKFTEDTDPISDMGIGGIVLRNDWEERRKQLEKDKEKLVKDADKDWIKYLKKLLVGKRITGFMQILPTFSKDMSRQIRKSSSGKMTIKVVDVVVSNSIEKDWGDSIILADDQSIIYKLELKEKIHIHE